MFMTWLSVPAGENVKIPALTRTTIREAMAKANWVLSPIYRASHDLQGLSRAIHLWDQASKGNKKDQQSE